MYLIEYDRFLLGKSFTGSTIVMYIPILKRITDVSDLFQIETEIDVFYFSTILLLRIFSYRLK